MLGDDFKVDAKGLERFLQQMLCHPVFGRDKHLEEFLINKHPPIRAKIKKGFLAGMKESLDIRKTSGVRDSDDFFQKEREWAFAYGKNIRDACDSFNSLMYAQLRFANQVGISLYEVWQYGLRSFQAGVTKLERFLHKNQHAHRKLLNFEFWMCQ